MTDETLFEDYKRRYIDAARRAFTVYAEWVSTIMEDGEKPKRDEVRLRDKRRRASWEVVDLQIEICDRLGFAALEKITTEECEDFLRRLPGSRTGAND